MATLGYLNKLKSGLESLHKETFEKIGQPSLTAEQAVASYLKLVNYGDRFQETTGEILQFSSNVATDLAESECFDQLCLEKCFEKRDSSLGGESTI